MRKSRILITLIAALAVAFGAPAAAAPVAVTGLTANWWQVVMIAPPGLFTDSLDGGNCIQGTNPLGDIRIFAAHAWAGESGQRACTVPVGATVVVPLVSDIVGSGVLACPARQSGCKGLLDTESEMRKYLDQIIRQATNLSATIDGQSVSGQRLKSPYFIASADADSDFANPSLGGYDEFVTGPEGNMFVSDGYWLIWKATSGQHTLTGAGTLNGVSSSWRHDLTVQ